MIRSRRHVALLAGILGLSLLSCGRDVTGPENGIGYGRNRIAALALEPSFPVIPGANAISDVVPFSRVRITLRRIDGTVTKDTTIDFPAGVDSVALAVDVPLPVTAPDSGLSLGLVLSYINAAGDTVFRGGPLAVTARPSGSAGSTQTVSIPVNWVPPGGIAPATVTLTPATGAVVSGTTTQFTAVVRDAQGNAMAGTPVLFFSPDTTRAVITGAGTGLVTWRAVRGNALIVATTPNLVADTSTFSVALPATRLLPVSGAAQSATINTLLGAPVVLRVTAADSVPVAGVPVTFAVTTGAGTLLASADTSDASGLVQFSWTLGALVGTQSVTATLSTNNATLATTATGTAPVPTQLAFTSSPGTGTAGATLAPVTVEVRDAGGVRTPLFTGPVTIALNGAGGAPLFGTLTVNAVGGIATFSDLSIQRAGAGMTFDATSPGLATATSAELAVSAAAAAEIGLVSGDAQAATVNTALPAPFVVRVTDAFANPVAGVTVSWAILSGGGALSVPTSVTDVSGLANVTLTLPSAAGAVTVTATATGLTGSPLAFAASALPGAASQLAFTGSTSTGTAGAVLTPGWTVEARDAAGNLVTSFTGPVTVALTNGPVAATLGGTATVNAVGGIATFANLTVDLVAPSWILSATSVGLTSASSGTFSITPAAAATIALASGGGQTATVATPVAQPFVVGVTDAFTNPVAGVTVNWAISAGGGALSVATSVTDAAGLASTSYTTGTAPGTAVVTGTVAGLVGSPVSFATTVTTGVAAQLVFTQQTTTGTAGAALTPGWTIEARDALGNLNTSFSGGITVTLGGGNPLAVLGGVTTVNAVGGIAAFTGLTVDLAAAGYTLSAAATGLSGATSGTFDIAAGAASAITGVAGTGQTGATLSVLADSLAFRVTDALGNPVAGVNVSANVSLGGGTVSPVSGNTDATGVFRTQWTLGTAVGSVAVNAFVTATPAITTAISATATPGAPAALVLVGTIGQQTAGVNLPDVLFEIHDAAGNIVTSYNGPVFGRISTSPQGPAPDSVTVTAVAGIATFTGINLSAAGDYVVRANLPSGAEGFTNLFAVLAGPAAFIEPALPASGDGQSAIVGTPLALPLRALVTDTEANGIPGIGVTYTTVRGVDTLDVTTVTTDGVGVASFTPIMPATVGPVQVIVTSVGLTGSGFSFTATATAGAAVRLAIAQQPGATTSNTAIPPVTVVAHDALGNLVAGFTGTIDVVVDSGPVLGWSLGGTQAIAAISGSATFGDLTLDRASQYRLRFRAAGLDSAITAPFLVDAGPIGQLVAVGGDAQSGPATQPLADSLAVRVADAFGNPIAGVTVTWTVISGGGALSPASSASGVDGIARARWTLGSSIGGQDAEASASGFTVPFTATASVTDANIVWTGAVNANWSEPGNWSGGAVPTAADSVRIPNVGNFPALNVQGFVSRLRVEPGATLQLDTFPLFVAGSLDIDAAATVLSDSLGAFVLLGSSGGTVRGTMPRLFVNAGTYSLSGALAVGGDLAVNGGMLEVGSGTVTVGGMFATSGTGVLSMTGAGTLTVQGDALLAGGSTAGLLTAGTLTVRGNFTQAGDASAFQAGPGHTLVMDGPAHQEFVLLNPDLSLTTTCAASCVGTFVANRGAGAGGLVFQSSVKATGGMQVTGDSLRATGHTIISAGTPDLSADVVIARYVGWQDALIRSANFQVDTLIAWGNGSPLIISEVIPTVVAGQHTITGVHPAPVLVSGPAASLDVVGAAAVGTGSGIALTTREDGRLLMTDAGDTLAVNGGADFGGTTVPGTMTAGVLGVAGDLIQTGAARTLFAEGGHLTRLFGTNPVIVFSDTAQNQLNALSLESASAVTFTTGAHVAGNVTLDASVSVVGSGAGTIRLGGSLFDAIGNRWQVLHTQFDGLDPLVPSQILGDVRFMQSITLDQPLSISGVTEVVAGTFDIGGRTFTANGDLVFNGTGRLRMANALDSVFVFGNALFAGASTAGQLTAGVLELHGALTQSTTADAFAASGSHQTWFRGTIAQSVNFADPGVGAGASHFAAVGLGQDGIGVAVQLNSDAVAAGMLLTEPAASLRFSSPTGQAFTSQGATVNGLTFDNVRWVLVDGGPVTAIDNVTFVNTSSTVAALDVQRSSGTVTVASPTFSATPTTGVYLRAEDPDGVTGGALVVNVTNATPATHGGFVLEVPPATITGWTVGGFEWTGATSSDWGVAANWAQNAVPGVSDSVYVPASGVTNLPLVLANTSIRALVNDNAGAVSIDDAVTLVITERAAFRDDLTGALCVGGTMEIGTGAASAALRGRIECPVSVRATNVSLDGPTTIPGTPNGFTVATGSDFAINGQRLVVAQTFRTEGTGRLLMVNPLDSLDVGIADFAGGATTGVLSFGDLVIRGGLQSGATPGSFGATGSHRTRFLAGIGDTVEVFAASSDIQFASLEVHRPVRLTGQVLTQLDALVSYGAAVVGPGRFVVNGTLTGTTSTLIAPRAVELFGVLADTGTFRPDSTIFTGSNQVLPFRIGAAAVPQYQTVLIAGTVQAGLTGGVDAIAGDLIILGGTLSVDDVGQTADLRIGRDLGVLGVGRLISTGNPHAIQVGRHATFDGFASGSDLAQGSLRVRGDFTQLATESPASFQPAPGYTVFLDSIGTVSFASPGTSRFAELVISETGADRTLLTDVDVVGVLGLNADGGATLRSDVLGSGGTRRLAADGVSQSGAMQFRNVTLRLQGTQAVNFTTTLTFADFDPTVVQLDIARENGTIDIYDPVFSSAPTSGLYLRAEDAAPGDAQDLIVNINGAATPAFHGGFATAIAPAVLNGWGANPDFTWTGGGTTSDWNTAANWAGGVVPSASDSVFVPGALLYNPSIPDGTTLRALVSARTESPITAAGTLTITERLVVPTQSGISCTVQLLFTNASTPMNASGLLGCFTRVLDGTLTASDTLLIGGAGDLQIEGTAILDAGADFVSVSGFFSTLGGAALRMQDDSTHVRLQQGASFGGGSTAGLLTAGLLEIGGNFTQNGNAESFAASGAHVTEFFGNVLQQAGFSVPGFGPGTSHFHHLALGQTEGGVSVQANSDIFATGQLRSGTGAVRTFSGAAVAAVHTAGANIADATFDGVRWELLDGAPVDGISGIVFTNQDAAATQFRIERAGGTVTADGLIFTGPPSTGLYLEAFDSDAAANGLLVVALTNTVPGGHFGFLSELNGATVTGWPAAAPFVWTGNADSDWSNTANWLDGVVPSATDSVTIQAIATNGPDIVSPTTLRALVNESAVAAVTLAAAPLTITERLVTLYGIPGINCSGTPALIMAPTTAATVAGRVACDVVISGSGTTTLSDSLLADVQLRIEGTGQLDVAGRYLRVLDSLITENSGTLVMTTPGGLVEASGDAHFRGGATTGLLTEGVLLLRRNLMQTGATNAFNASGNHITRFTTEGVQTVSFLNPGTDGAASHFAHMEISQAPTSRVDLLSDISIVGQLRDQMASIAQLRGDAVRRIVEANGTNLTGIRLDRVLLSLTDGAPVDAMSDVIFDSLGVFSDQFVVSRSGGTVPLVNPVFVELPQDGYQLMTITDVAPLDNDTLRIVVTNPTPGGTSGLVTLIGGAQLLGWPVTGGEVWTGAGGNSLWSNAANWSLGRIPVATDSVVINGAATVDLNEAATVSWLAMGIAGGSPTLNLNNGATLQVDSAAFTGPGSTVYLGGGAVLTGDGGVSVGGQLTWDGGTMSGTGVTVLAAGGTANIGTSQTAVLDARPFAVGGTALIGSSGMIGVGAPDLSVLSTGVLEFQGAASLFAGAGGADSIRITNTGVLRKSSSPATVRIDWPIVNTGTIDVQIGTLDLRNRLSHLAGGSIAIAPGATLLDLGTISASAGSTVTIGNGALLHLQGGGVNANPGNHDFAAGSSISGQGTLRTVNTDTVTIAGTVNIDSLVTGLGRIELNSADTVNIGGGAYQGGGFFSGSAVVAISGTFTIAAGNPDGTGTLFIRPSGLLEVTGGGIRGWDIDVAGTWRWGETNLSLLQDPANPGNYPQVNIRTGGLFDIVHAATPFTMTGTNSVITNNGTVRKSTGSANSTLTMLDILNFTGFVIDSPGNLTITNGCTQNGPLSGSGAGSVIGGCIN